MDEIPELDFSKMVAVPDVIGMEQKVAEKVLEERGLQAQVSWTSGLDESLEIYYIGEQSIPVNSVVPAGTTVRIERMTKKIGTPVVVPSLIGMEQEEARIVALNCGLKYMFVWTVNSYGMSDEYYVVGQSTAENTVVMAGDVIKLELSATKPGNN